MVGAENIDAIAGQIASAGTVDAAVYVAVIEMAGGGHCGSHWGRGRHHRSADQCEGDRESSRPEDRLLFFQLFR